MSRVCVNTPSSGNEDHNDFGRFVGKHQHPGGEHVHAGNDQDANQVVKEVAVDGVVLHQRAVAGDAIPDHDNEDSQHTRHDDHGHGEQIEPGGYQRDRRDQAGDGGGCYERHQLAADDLVRRDVRRTRQVDHRQDGQPDQGGAEHRIQGTCMQTVEIQRIAALHREEDLGKRLHFNRGDCHQIRHDHARPAPGVHFSRAQEQGGVMPEGDGGRHRPSLQPGVGSLLEHAGGPEREEKPQPRWAEGGHGRWAEGKQDIYEQPAQRPERQGGEPGSRRPGVPGDEVQPQPQRQHQR